MVAPCTIKLLGGLHVEWCDRLITRFRTRQTGALLACLALYREQAHPRDTLVELFWPGEKLDAARHKLRLALSFLRRQLEPPGVAADTVLIADRAFVQLNPRVVSTDVAAFEAALRAADWVGSPLDRIALLDEAIALYPGELLPGLIQAFPASRPGIRG